MIERLVGCPTQPLTAHPLLSTASLIVATQPSNPTSLKRGNRYTISCMHSVYVQCRVIDALMLRAESVSNRRYNALDVECSHCL